MPARPRSCGANPTTRPFRPSRLRFQPSPQILLRDAVRLDPFSTRRGAAHDAERPGLEAEPIAKERQRRFIRGPAVRCGSHPNLDDSLRARPGYLIGAPPRRDVDLKPQPRRPDTRRSALMPAE